MAWIGLARRGMAGLGMAGEAGHGAAWQGLARWGRVRRGKDWQASFSAVRVSHDRCEWRINNRREKNGNDKEY